MRIKQRDESVRIVMTHISARRTYRNHESIFAIPHGGAEKNPNHSGYKA